MNFATMLASLETTMPWKAVAIDSRRVNPGDLFVAIPGERVDGHDYIAQAIERGATAILAQRAPQSERESSVSYWQVPDTVVALGQIAAAWRKHRALPVIGITGSCGKTTVKGMLGSILSVVGETLVTQGNYNNQIGMPLTLLKLKDSHQYAVIEMGASQTGDIEYLGALAKPDVAVITQVAPAHLKGFGSVDGVAKAKAEIYTALSTAGTAILNQDDPYYDSWHDHCGDKKQISFGFSPKANVTAKAIHYAPFNVQFELVCGDKPAQPVTIAIPGKHTVMNALAASACAMALGIAPATIARGLESFTGVDRRMQRHPGPNQSWILDDTYNANPSSMRAAIDVLAGCTGKKILVMGMMGELGPDSDALHASVGEHAKAQGIDCLMSVGSLTAPAVAAFGEDATLFDDKATLSVALKAQLLKDPCTVLIKGSRSAEMETISDAFILRKEPLC